MQLSLLIDPPQDGLTNMAVDEALLAMAAAGEIGPVLRFYEWSPATLSLGYFQRYAERAAHPASAECDVVRRASGGGAILHDRELTYSLVLPAGHPLTARAEPLYRAVHQALIDVLAERGLVARFWDDVSPAIGSPGASPSQDAFACGDMPDELPTFSLPLRVGANRSESTDKNFTPPSAQRPTTNDPFLCFQRRSPGDLVLRASGETSADPAAWHKILGSAQRRRHGAVLQHGSLLWGRSSFAPELLGVSDLTGTDFAESNFPEVMHAWSGKLAQVLEFALVPRGDSAATVVDPWLTTAREKFHEPDWLHSR